MADPLPPPPNPSPSADDADDADDVFVFPASFAQQRLWFLDQLDPGSAAYNMAGALRLRGTLDIAAAERVLTEVVRRHEVLRTTFAVIDGAPVQLIARPGPFLLGRETTAPEDLAARAQAFAAEPFDLARGPLLRVTLLALGPADHALLFAMHHAISDAWSMNVLVREVTRLYLAFARGRPSPLPELAVQYADYAVWQRAWLTGDHVATQLAYWKAALAGLPSLELPTDRPRPAAQRARGAYQPLALGRDLSARLHALALAAGVTPFIALLSAFAALLGRWTGQRDIAIGTPITNRPQDELERLIGFFVNTLVIRVDLSGAPAFRDVLARVKETALDAYTHQAAPFEDVVEALHPARDLRRPPLFSVMFVLHNAPDAAIGVAADAADAADAPDLAIEPIRVESGTAKFDLMLALGDGPDGFDGGFEYRTDLFDASTIARLARHFETLLRAIAVDPGRNVWATPLLDEHEREVLLADWSGAGADPRSEASAAASVSELFAARVQERPDAPAIVSGAQVVTYGELDRRSTRIASALIVRGAGPERPVAICMQRSPELIAAVLGVLAAGGAYVACDPAIPPERLASIVRDCGAAIVLVDASTEARARGLAPHIVCIDPTWADSTGPAEPHPPAAIAAEQAAYVTYTSGSTGEPKGVVVPHGSLASMARALVRDFALDASDRVLQFTSPAWDTFGEELYPCLAAGATLVLRTDTAIDPHALLALCRDHAVTVVDLPTAYWHELVRTLEVTGAALPPSLRLVVIGGEAAQPAKIGAWLERVGRHPVLLNTYGATEATAVTTRAVLAAPVTGSSASIGRPTARATTYVLDALGEPAPIGVLGELYLGGAGVARGYLGRPDLTAAHFVPDPFAHSPGARLYRSGDVARYASDGQLELAGRRDAQLKIRGFRVELGEIESALSAHPGVRAAAVSAVQDDRGDKRLVAFWVPDASAPDAEALRRFLAGVLPEYMIPATWVALDRLPVTATGKIDRAQLRPPALPASDPRVFVRPRTDVERRLAQIWEQVLGRPSLGVRDNFFELGGHSLLAVRLFAEIENQFGRRLPLRVLFEQGTIEHLALLLEDRAEIASPSLAVAIRGGTKPAPWFFVHPIGGHVLCYAELARVLDDDRAFYGMQAPGLEPGSAPIDRIEELAARYVAAIRAIQPRGPYHLGGWSFGGLVAFEIARQLSAHGERLGVVALVDSTLGSPADHAARVHDILRLFVHDLAGLAGREPPPRRPDSAHLPIDGQLAIAFGLARAANILPASLSLATFRSLFAVFRAHWEARARYAPEPLDVAITLFQAADGLAHGGDLAHRRWARLAARAVDRCVVPGDHFSLLRGPQVARLARELALRTAREDAQTASPPIETANQRTPRA